MPADLTTAVLRIRPRWRRIVYAPKLFRGHYRLLRQHGVTRLVSLETAWRLMALVLRPYAYRAAIAEEREACAQLADHHAAEVQVVPAGTLDGAKMIAGSAPMASKLRALR